MRVITKFNRSCWSTREGKQVSHSYPAVYINNVLKT